MEVVPPAPQGGVQNQPNDDDPLEGVPDWDTELMGTSEEETIPQGTMPPPAVCAQAELAAAAATPIPCGDQQRQPPPAPSPSYLLSNGGKSGEEKREERHAYIGT
eukprot:CAMPEP_0184377848 /NCGR_PEP_ID=MMETSP0007-20130409/2603_1 /TAXON_ID=97485 /ORGANISM="Prymnesium parvum, Strain Texoma1" /LENGTH=104 /DNA_ID=CAMNT_0026721897 /DNA_START=89 /DNA_END=407 /DNA_ORIENTATION=-